MELCLIVAERTIEKALAVIDRHGSCAHSLEIRADYLDPVEYDRLQEIRPRTDKRLIFTVRKKADGGRWSGSEKSRRQLYERAFELKFDYVDIEIGALPGIKGSEDTSVIRSFHDLEGVPQDILEKYIIAQTDPHEIPKIAVMLKTSADAIRFLRWNKMVHRMGPRKRIVTAMGLKGSFSRVLGKKIGTMHTYVPAPSKILVPGMIDIHQLVNRYRVHEIDLETRVHGLLDNFSSFIPPTAASFRAVPSAPKNTVRVPFVLDSSEEMSHVKDFFEVQRFYRTTA